MYIFENSRELSDDGSGGTLATLLGSRRTVCFKLLSLGSFTADASSSRLEEFPIIERVPTCVSEAERLIPAFNFEQ